MTYNNDRNVYVVDCETTGLNGVEAGDRVVEIGIARVDIVARRVYPEYSKVVRTRIERDRERAWVFQNTSLTVDDVRKSPYTCFDVFHDLHTYANQPVTAYNRAFDIDKFLSHSPYSFNPADFPCLMELAAEYVGTRDHAGGSRWPKAQTAYNELCPDNPANLVGGLEEHRALSDAIMEGHILLGVLKKDSELQHVLQRRIRTINNLWDGVICDY